MPIPEYLKAHKSAVKAYRQDLLRSSYPYLPVLDELLSFTDTAGEMDLGLVDIPAELIKGTKSSGRTKAFASNFMPLLEENSEFAAKWCALYQSHLKEGIREPVIACEFMNSYYIIEGNKRVSVLKFSGAVSVAGYVTRILPAPSDTEEYRIYQEYMDFYRVSSINTIYFSREGSFKRLCALMGKDFAEPWNEEERSIFSSCLLHFAEVFRKKKGEKLSITEGDAFLTYLSIYGYKDMLEKSSSELKEEVAKLWIELEALPEDRQVNLVLKPRTAEETIEETLSGAADPLQNASAVLQSASNVLLKKLFPSESRLKTGFIYYRTAETSGWTNGHDLGRMHLENSLGDQIETFVYDGAESDDDALQLIEKAAADGCQVLFTTSPRFLGASIKAAVCYPKLKILNCSVNAYSGHLRTYYGRLYEAKFLVGMLAGILTDTGQVGYVADVPIFGASAAINAFALGVKMVNPKARIHLVWSMEKRWSAGTSEGSYDLLKQHFDSLHVSHVSGRDTISPRTSGEPYGLYGSKEDGPVLLAAAIWHWGKFYQRIVQTILNGKWERTAPERLGDSINYWWGISSGMIDIIYSKTLPRRTRQLTELVKHQIVSENFQIFSGELRDQNGVLRCQEKEALSPTDIVRMDWLADNVEGGIPEMEELTEEAAAMAEIQGLHTGKVFL